MGLGLSLSNVFGLTMLICFLGYGMVEFPRYIWYQSNLDRMLAFYEFQGSKLIDKVEDELDELITQYAIIKKLRDRVGDDDKLRPLVEQIVATVCSIYAL
jgi:hypothetical protein